MASTCRIVTADRTPLISGLTRAALDLLERSGTVISVPSGKAALAELKRGEIDLLISAPALADMRGAELALQAHKANADLPIVILAGTDDPADDQSALAGSLFVYLERPADGEQFVRVIRALLDGEPPFPAAAPPQESPAAPLAAAASVPDLGPVPPVNVGALADSLASLLNDVGAMAVVLVDRAGNILQEMGAVGYLDRDRLSATLAPTFANMVRVGSLVGGARPQAMHFYDGEEFDIFALAVGLHHFICLIFEGSAGSRAFGAVTMFGRRAVNEMLAVIGDAAFTITVVQEGAGARRKSAKRKTQEIHLTDIQQAQEEKPALYEPPQPQALEPLPEDADLEAVLGSLDKVDLSQAEDLFDPERLARIAAEKMAGERLSYDDAQQLGVLPQD